MSPDGSTKPPPEEKLLRLIRGKGARPEGSADRVALPPKDVSRMAVGGAFAVRAQGLQWPQLVMGGIALVIVVEAICLAVQLMRPLPTVRTQDSGSLPTVEPRIAPQPLDDLPSLASSTSRPLFAIPVETAATPTTQPATRTTPSTAAKLLASRLSLMGIVAGEPAQAVIEDAQTKKTYFVTTGQAVVEGAVLEQVLDNRVILNLDGEKIELTL